jgi:class 3 adenylate cyclase
MNSADPASNPDFVSPPDASGTGQRTLAAIVFTDAVSFSRMMSRDEERGLRLVARDLAAMRTVCETFGGQVLKSTGDGLLMLFTSAVQAVSCGLEIQRNFEMRNLEVPRNERLQHRIGIHLGDVFQHGGDVMGDGVNVAARLQTEAIPGGVCLSKTVYDVVQNRVPFYVADEGPRKLKNIGTIIAYQISPTENRRHYLGRIRRWARTGLIIGIVFGVAVIVPVFMFRLGSNKQRLADQELQKMAQELNPAGSPISASAKAIGSGAPDGSADLDTASPGPYPEAGKIPATDAQFEFARFNYMKNYDFSAMSAWLEKYDCPSANEDKLDEICVPMRELFDWCHLQLQNYSAQKPLMVHSDRDNENYAFWPEPSGGVMVKTGAGTQMLPKDQIPPIAMAGIAAQLIRQNATPHTTATWQLWRGLKFFIQTYQVKISPQWQKELDAIPDEVASAAP